MSASAQDAAAQAVAHALQTVFLVATPVALVALAVVLLLREVPLRGAPERKPPAPTRGVPAQVAP
jgi:hypothetical protein